MLHFCTPVLSGMPAALQNIIETDDIALNIRVRVRNGIAHARLRRQIYHQLRLFLRKQIAHSIRIRNICLFKSEIFIPLQAL